MPSPHAHAAGAEIVLRRGKLGRTRRQPAGEPHVAVDDRGRDRRRAQLAVDQKPRWIGAVACTSIVVKSGPPPTARRCRGREVDVAVAEPGVRPRRPTVSPAGPSRCRPDRRHVAGTRHVLAGDWPGRSAGTRPGTPSRARAGGAQARLASRAPVTASHLLGGIAVVATLVRLVGPTGVDPGGSVSFILTWYGARPPTLPWVLSRCPGCVDRKSAVLWAALLSWDAWGRAAATTPRIRRARTAASRSSSITASLGSRSSSRIGATRMPPAITTTSTSCGTTSRTSAW